MGGPGCDLGRVRPPRVYGVESYGDSYIRAADFFIFPKILQNEKACNLNGDRILLKNIKKEISNDLSHLRRIEETNKGLFLTLTVGEAGSVGL